MPERPGLINELRAEFERITEGLSDALDFSQTIGYTAGQDCTSYERGGTLGPLDAVDFYTRFVDIGQLSLLYSIMLSVTRVSCSTSRRH